MTFDEVFASVEIGAMLAVSNGRPAPPIGTLRWRVWRASNFSGPLKAKNETPPRALVIQSDEDCAPGRTIAYEIVEGDGHTFELAE